MIFRKNNRIQNTSRRIQRKIGAIIDPKQKRHTFVVSPELYRKSRDFQIKFLKHVGLVPKDYLLDIVIFFISPLHEIREHFLFFFP